MRAPASILWPALFLLASCDSPKPEPVGGKDRPLPPQPATEDHGRVTDLGSITLAGKKFTIARLGDLKTGVEGAFEVHPDEAAAPELAQWSFYLWVEDGDGTQLSAPAKGEREESSIHFHVTPRESEKPPERVVLRLRGEGLDVRGHLPLSGHGHEHRAAPPADG